MQVIENKGKSVIQCLIINIMLTLSMKCTKILIKTMSYELTPPVYI